MDPEAFRSTFSDLALGSAMAAAARDYKKELIAQGNAPTSDKVEDVDIDELMNDPELEKLHADRIAALKKEAEKRQALERKGHGEYREVTEGEFLDEVTKSQNVVCHFYHREFIRCKIVDKHLKLLAPKYFDTKFIRVDAENSPFFVTKLSVKTLPCVILLRNGVAFDRLVGFQDLGARDDFSTKVLESWLIKKGIIRSANKKEDDNDDDDERDKPSRSLRSSVLLDSDSE